VSKSSTLSSEDRTAIADALGRVVADSDRAMRARFADEFRTIDTRLGMIERRGKDVLSKTDQMDHRLSRALAGPARRPQPGRAFVLACAAMAAGHVRDYTLAEKLNRSAQAAATTTAPGWAAEIALPAFASFVLSLSPQSAFAAIAARGTVVSLEGVLGAKVPTAGPIVATWVGEAKPKPVVQGTFTNATMEPRKVAVLIGVSEELARSPNAEPAFRRMLADAAVTAIDLAFFDATAGSAVRPPGMLVGLTPIAPSAAGPNAMTTDMANLVAALTAPSDPIFVASPSTRLKMVAALGPAFDYPIVASAAVPNTRLVVIDASGLVTAMGEAEIITSNEAAFELDSAPAGDLEDAGSYVSMWQQDLIGLRVRAEASWARRAGSAAFTEPIAW
jgi:HK97 family phage major capsid protein